MIIKKQRHFILLSILLIAALFLCSGQVFAEEVNGENLNAFEFRFVQTAKTFDGKYVYELQIRQTAKVNDDPMHYGVFMCDLFFKATGKDLKSVDINIVKSADPNNGLRDFEYEMLDETSFNICEWNPNNAPWTTPENGFTYLCTVVTNAPAEFDFTESNNPKCPESIIGTDAHPDSAQLSLVSPGLIGEITASDNDSVDLGVIAPADGHIIAAAYNAQGRMIAPIVVEEATIPVLPAGWDMTTRAEAVPTELTLDCDTSELAEVRVFLVSDLAVLKPLTPHLILEYSNN